MIIMYQISSNIKYTNNWVFLFVVSAMTQRWTKSRRLHDAAATCRLRMKRRWAESFNTNCRTIHTHHTQSFHIYSSVVVRPSECLSLCTNSQRKTEIEIFSPRNIYLFLFGWDGKEYFKSRFPLFNSCSPAQRSNGYYAFVCVYWMILSFSCWSGNIAKTPEM